MTTAISSPDVASAPRRSRRTRRPRSAAAAIKKLNRLLLSGEWGRLAEEGGQLGVHTTVKVERTLVWRVKATTQSEYLDPETGVLKVTTGHWSGEEELGDAPEILTGEVRSRRVSSTVPAPGEDSSYYERLAREIKVLRITAALLAANPTRHPDRTTSKDIRAKAGQLGIKKSSDLTCALVRERLREYRRR